MTSKYNQLVSKAYYMINVRQNINNDIFEHLKTLQNYSQHCNSVIELGVRLCVSSYPIVLGLLNNLTQDKSKRMVSVDLIKHEGVIEFEKLVGGLVNYEFYTGNDLDYNITENFDMVFIDTWHVRGQLERELKKYAPRCNKYIVMHDTTVDEFVGESIRCGANIAEQSRLSGFSVKEIQEGLWPAVMDFLRDNSEWKIRERYINNNGLTILEKVCDHVDC